MPWLIIVHIVGPGKAKACSPVFVFVFLCLFLKKAETCHEDMMVAIPFQFLKATIAM